MPGINRATECQTPEVGGFLDVGRFAIDEHGTEAGMMHAGSHSADGGAGAFAGLLPDLA
jgi:hypothetical protein